MLTKDSLEEYFNSNEKDLKYFIDNIANGDIPFASLFQAFFDNDLVHLNIEEKGSLRFDIDMSDFAENSEYVASYDLKLNDESLHDGVSLDNINAMLETILEGNPSYESRKDVIFTYLFRGYQKINSSERAVIDSIDFSCLGEDFNPPAKKSLST